MKRVLDIDMDFFLDDIAYFINSDTRLSNDDYNPWQEKEFREFLEKKCGLSKKDKKAGRIIIKHDEAFDFLNELIDSKQLNIPCEYIHIDAHSDLGLGDSSWFHLVSELTHYPIKERINFLNREKVMMSNYLAYIIACGWIEKIDLVYPEKWDFNDFVSLHLENNSDNSGNFEFKTYDKSLESSDFRHPYKSIKPIKSDSLIPFRVYDEKSYHSVNSFDVVIFCQSPDYTPQSADYMIDIIKEYIIEI